MKDGEREIRRERNICREDRDGGECCKYILMKIIFEKGNTPLGNGSRNSLTLLEARRQKWITSKTEVKLSNTEHLPLL